MKQKLEGLVSATLKHNKYWYLKLQVTPLAHHKMPADYIVVKENNSALLECKQITGKNGRFNFDRLTQELSLVHFLKSSPSSMSYVILLFYDEKLKSSSVYIIDIRDYISIKLEKLHQDIKSISAKDLDEAGIKKYTVAKGLITDFYI